MRDEDSVPAYESGKDQIVRFGAVCRDRNKVRKISRVLRSILFGHYEFELWGRVIEAAIHGFK